MMAAIVQTNLPQFTQNGLIVLYALLLTKWALDAMLVYFNRSFRPKTFIFLR
jgi:hypothetical protein